MVRKRIGIQFAQNALLYEDLCFIHVYLNLCIIKIFPLLGVFTHLKEKIYTIMISQWYDDNFYRIKNKNIDRLPYKHRDLRPVPRTCVTTKV